MMVLSGYLLLSGGHRSRTCVCFRLPLVGLVLLSLGMLALFVDLEHKLHVWRLYVTVEPRSPMSWGAWILVLVYPMLVAMALVQPPDWARRLLPSLDPLARRLQASPSALRAIGTASVLGGIALGIYTGILLSALGARPLWNSALLGPLFLVSGLSSGAAFAHLVADGEERRWLARADNGFLAAELALVALFLIGLSSAGAAHAAAAGLFLGGPYTAVFWVLVVGIGIVVPLAVQALAVAGRIEHAAIAPVLVLLGGLALRFVIVVAGQYSHWPRV
jgi:formate-dependent nitrite reductase membrane component NrfD